MNLLNALEKSHQNLRALGEQLTQNHNNEQTDKIFNELWEQFFAHEKAEEYIALKIMKRGDIDQEFSEDALQFAVDEHHYFERFVEDIALLPMHDTRRQDLIKELISQLDNHMKHEEAFIFPKLVEQLSEEKQMLLVKEYIAKLKENKLVRQ